MNRRWCVHRVCHHGNKDWKYGQLLREEEVFGSMLRSVIRCSCGLLFSSPCYGRAWQQKMWLRKATGSCGISLSCSLQKVYDLRVFERSLRFFPAYDHAICKRKTFYLAINHICITFIPSLPSLLHVNLYAMWRIRGKRENSLVLIQILKKL